MIMSVEINNANHPELKKAEVFLINVISEKVFNDINYKTKRMGAVAYSEPGKEIKKLCEGGGPFPVFVQKAEYDEINK
jgi:hypothetical protein